MSLKLTDFVLIEKSTKKIFALNYGSTRIGRKSENNIIIQHMGCSKFHSTITIRGTTIYYHDFSNNGSNVMIRSGFKTIQNQTVKLYENSKIRIANREFKITKLKNEKSRIIEISDSESNESENEEREEINHVSSSNQINPHKQSILRKILINNSKNNESKARVNEESHNQINYNYKKQKIHEMIMTSTKNLTSDEEIEIYENVIEKKKRKKKQHKSKEFVSTTSESEEEPPTRLLTEDEIKKEIVSQDEYEPY